MLCVVLGRCEVGSVRGAEGGWWIQIDLHAMVPTVKVIEDGDGEVNSPKKKASGPEEGHGQTYIISPHCRADFLP